MTFASLYNQKWPQKAYDWFDTKQRKISFMGKHFTHVPTIHNEILYLNHCLG